MSDKALKYIKELDEISGTVWSESNEDLAKHFQEYADQEKKAYLKKVLEEIKNYWIENEEPYRTTQFNNGVAWLLTHLKQTKG